MKAGQFQEEKTLGKREILPQQAVALKPLRRGREQGLLRGEAMAPDAVRPKHRAVRAAVRRRLDQQPRFMGENLLVNLTGDGIRAADMENQRVRLDRAERNGQRLAQPDAEGGLGPHPGREIQFRQVADEIAGLADDQRQQPDRLGRGEGAGRAFPLAQLAAEQGPPLDFKTVRQRPLLFLRLKFHNGHRRDRTQII